MICRSAPPRATRATRALRTLRGLFSAPPALLIFLCAAQISACAWIDAEERFVADEDPTFALVETYPAKGAAA